MFQPIHLLILLVFLPVFLAVLIIPYWMIFKKAGFTPLLGLLMVVPMVNLIVLYVVAFSQWRVVPAAPDYPPYPPVPQPGYVPPAAYAAPPSYPPQQPPPSGPQSV